MTSMPATRRFLARRIAARHGVRPADQVARETWAWLYRWARQEESTLISYLLNAGGPDWDVRLQALLEVRDHVARHTPLPGQCWLR